MLHLEVASWTTVYDYFRTWKKNGLFEQLHDRLRPGERCLGHCAQRGLTG